MLRLASKRMLGLASREALSRPLQILPHFYHKNVVHHSNNPSLGTALVGSRTCAQTMNLKGGLLFGTLKSYSTATATGSETGRLQDNIRSVFERSKDGVIYLDNSLHDGHSKQSSAGTGFLVDGWIITSAHVVAEAAVVPDPQKLDQLPVLSEVFCTSWEGHTFKAAIYVIDFSVDIAILKPLESLSLPNLELESEENVLMCDLLIAIGHPLRNSSTTSGILSFLNRKLSTIPTLNPQKNDINLGSDVTVIQTTVPTCPDYSGGPILNLKGKVIGVFFYGIEDTDLSFCIPAKEVRRCLENAQLLKTKIEEGAPEGTLVLGLGDCASNDDGVSF